MTNLEDIAARLVVLDRERAELLDQQRAELQGHERTRRVSLRRLAEEMGVRPRPLIDAARSGRLKAWRIGGEQRGEIVTTREAIDAYLDTQPVASPKGAERTRAKEVYRLAVERMRKR